MLMPPDRSVTLGSAGMSASSGSDGVDVAARPSLARTILWRPISSTLLIVHRHALAAECHEFRPDAELDRAFAELAVVAGEPDLVGADARDIALHRAPAGRSCPASR